MNNLHSQAIEHALQVAAYVIGSAVIPCLLSLYSNNPYFLLLTPVINALAAGLVKYSGLKAAQTPPQS